MALNRLIYITDRTNLPSESGLLGVLESLLTAGLRTVYLREKDVGPTCFANLAREVCSRCTAANATVILPANAPLIDEFPNAFLQATARTQVLPALRARWGAQRCIGYSAHSLDEALRAEDQGADYLFFSPIFSTPTHPTMAAQGIEALHDVCHTVRIPVYALGGVKPQHIKDILLAGAYGVAAVSALQTPNGEQTCRTFLNLLG